ncbi:MAG TPA: formate dehydrogenase accessory sulfurtransferase FdhD [Anaerolineales bacterium]
MSEGARETAWREYRRGWRDVEGEVIEEGLVTLYVNGVEWATIMCTPREQDWLALGFLANEGFLETMDEVEILHVSGPGCCVDLWLNHPASKPEREIITSGCGGGLTFDDPESGIPPLEDELRMEPERLYGLFNQLHLPGSLHGRARGVHAAGLSDGERLLLVVEDVGRHNTIDKLRGGCLAQGLDTRGKLLLATGRVSSEMLRKGARMGCPIIASRNSPTSMSVAMAEAFNITLAGYVRQGSMRVYTHPERLGLTQAVDWSPAGGRGLAAESPQEASGDHGAGH